MKYRVTAFKNYLNYLILICYIAVATSLIFSTINLPCNKHNLNKMTHIKITLPNHRGDCHHHTVEPLLSGYIVQDRDHQMTDLSCVRLTGHMLLNPTFVSIYLTFLLKES